MAAPKQRRGRVVLTLMAIAVIASLWRTVSVEDQKRRVSVAFDEAQERVDRLQAERTDLSQALRGSRKKSKGQETDLRTLREELEQVQVDLDDAMQEIASLRREQDRLREENQSLSTRLSSVSDEKAHLQGRLSSLKELKLAIRDVKRKLWSDRWARWSAPWKERRERVRTADDELLASGNQGYVVKQGKSTLGESPRMHVRVLEPQFP